MKLPRNLSGADLTNTLCKHWGYDKVRQSGSHIILVTQIPSHQRIAIPNHKTLRIGTLHTILRSVSNHKKINRQDILDDL